jgi:hypothetical protein
MVNAASTSCRVRAAMHHTALSIRSCTAIGTNRTVPLLATRTCRIEQIERPDDWSRPFNLHLLTRGRQGIQRGRMSWATGERKPSRGPRSPGRAVPDEPVDSFAQQVGVADMPGVLVLEVHHDAPRIRRRTGVRGRVLRRLIESAVGERSTVRRQRS